MATPAGFQLGLLPERKLNKRALAASYGFLIFLLIVMVNIGWIWPDGLDIRRQYHVPELIPMPRLPPTAVNVQPRAPPVTGKLLAEAPVVATPNPHCPREDPSPRPHPPAAMRVGPASAAGVRGSTRRRAWMKRPRAARTRSPTAPACARRPIWRASRSAAASSSSAAA